MAKICKKNKKIRDRLQKSMIRMIPSQSPQLHHLMQHSQKTTSLLRIKPAKAQIKCMEGLRKKWALVIAKQTPKTQ